MASFRSANKLCAYKKKISFDKKNMINFASKKNSLKIQFSFCNQEFLLFYITSFFLNFLTKKSHS